MSLVQRWESDMTNRGVDVAGYEFRKMKNDSC